MAPRRHAGKAGVPASSSLRVSLITLLTDFGRADYFVAAMQAVILTANPLARMVDVNDAMPPRDIEAPAFPLFAACPSFPAGTIHVAVVDPGVGSSRRAILIRAREQY